MKIEWKIDLTPIIVSLILAVAAVTVADILRPPRFTPVGIGDIGTNARGFRLDTETGLVSFGP